MWSKVVSSPAAGPFNQLEQGHVGNVMGIHHRVTILQQGTINPPLNDNSGWNYYVLVWQRV